MSRAICKYIHIFGKEKDHPCDRPPKENGYCTIHVQYEHGSCRVPVAQGERRGQPCGKPCHEAGALSCTKHIGVSHLLNIPDGMKKCSKPRCVVLIPSSDRYCKECQTVKDEKDKTLRKCSAVIAQNERKGKPCLFEAEDGSKYCGKHRDRGYLRDYAKSLGLTICGNGARCENMVHEGKTCDDCLEYNRHMDKARYDTKQQNTEMCIKCGKSNEFAVGLRNVKTRFCSSCYEALREVEENRDRSVGCEAFRNPQLYFNRYAYDASRRGLSFDLSYSEFTGIIAKGCHYCGILNEQAYNGVDRVNNNVGYSISNCVSACKMCNYMKATYSPNEFIQHCGIIYAYTSDKQIPPHLMRLEWSGRDLCSYSEYIRSNARRSKDVKFNLSEEEFYRLKTEDCYLCGRKTTDTSLHGIDRVDSNKHYTSDNVKPCCFICNKMKNEFDVHAFLETCKRISVGHLTIST